MDRDPSKQNNLNNQKKQTNRSNTNQNESDNTRVYNRNRDDMTKVFKKQNGQNPNSEMRQNNSKTQNINRVNPNNQNNQNYSEYTSSEIPREINRSRRPIQRSTADDETRVIPAAKKPSVNNGGVQRRQRSISQDARQKNLTSADIQNQQKQQNLQNQQNQQNQLPQQKQQSQQISRPPQVQRSQSNKNRIRNGSQNNKKPPLGNTSGKRTTKKSPRYNKNTAVTAKNYDESSSTSFLSNMMKAVIYIVGVLIISGFLSYYAIVISNDVFAFVKSDMQLDVTISEYDTTSDIAQKLYDFGVIKYPSIFRIYAKARKYADSFKGGTYTISPSMSYDQLIKEFQAKNIAREQISITIREGWTVDDIIEHFLSNGMGTRAKFVEAIQNYDFDYWFIDELEENISPDRKYRLEGYLFPDTYYFYTDSTEVAILNKMLANFEVKYVNEYREWAKTLGLNGYTVDEIITIASLIQMEARLTSEYGKISGVFHNRLLNPTYETVNLLQSDAAIQYALPERKTSLTAEDLAYNSPYNTYMYKGLPPGPICNPSLDAIHYALEPTLADDDGMKLFYFVSYPGGSSLFAETNVQHNYNRSVVAAATGGN